MAASPSSNINTEEIIDLDNYICNDERIQMWLDSFYEQIKISYGYEDVNTLENLMKWYINYLHTEVKNIKINRNVSAKIEKHIFYFHINFKRLNVISDATYLDYVEDILAFYLDCEVKRYINETRRRVINKKFMRSRILNLLSVYLINKEERYHYVLMKMQSVMSSEAVKSYIHTIYMAIFSRKPFNKSDKAFCSAFILSKRWKKTISPKCWPTLDEIIKELYGRHPNTIETNSVWKKIASSSGLLDSKDQLGNNDKALCEAYLKYVKSINLDDNTEMKNKEENPGTSQPRSSRLFQNTKQISELEQILEDCRRTKIKEDKNVNSKEKNVSNTSDVIDNVDDDDDDDCIIVSEGPTYIDPQDLVVEILDDDDDDDDNLINKETRTKISPKKKEEVPFLDSMDITGCSSSKADNLTTKNNFKKSKNNRSQRSAEKVNGNQPPIIINDETDNMSEENNNIIDSSKNSQSSNDLEYNYDDTPSSPWPHSISINFHELIASTKNEWKKLKGKGKKKFEDHPLPEKRIEESNQKNQNNDEPSSILNDTETKIVCNEVEIDECNKDAIEQASNLHIDDTNIGMENTGPSEPNLLRGQLRNNSSGEVLICSDFEETEKLAVNQTKKILDDEDMNSHIQEVRDLNMNGIHSFANDDCLSVPTIKVNQVRSLMTLGSNFKAANVSGKLFEEKRHCDKKKKKIICPENDSVYESTTVTPAQPSFKPTIQTIPSNEILDDLLLKSKPLVIVERLSDIEIEGWNRISEKTRKIKCFEIISRNNPFKPQETLNNRKGVKENSTRLVTNNDTGFFKRTYEGKWRETQEPNIKEKESDIKLILKDCATSSTACTNLCCHYISKLFENLTICTGPNFHVFSAFCNPHYQMKKAHRRQEIQEATFATVNYFTHPPVISEVEEFESVSPLPLDLSNIKLNKLASHPVMNSSHLREYCKNNIINLNWDSSNKSSKKLRNKETAIIFKKHNEIKKLNLSEEKQQIRLPLKKRKHSMSNLTEQIVDDNCIDSQLIEEIIKRARIEKYGKDDISYPARPAISIAEIQL